MNAPAVATRSAAPATTSQLLKVLGPEIAKALPKGMDADRMTRLVTTEIRKSRNAKAAGIAKQSLEDCTQESFAGALLNASALGLEPGINGECYLVPYRDNRRRVVECQLIVGYQGIVKLFWQHPRASRVDCQWVGEHDEFRFSKGLNPVLEHRPAIGDRGRPIYFYAIVEVTGAQPLWDVFTADEIKELRRGKVGSSGDIKDPQHWMERKTALKQVLKLAPKTTRLDMAIARDDKPGTALVRELAMELPAGVAPTQDYIEGEVDPGPLADDPGPADYPADDPGPAEPAAAVPTEVVMASRKQLGQLKQIRDAEKYDADLEWFGFLSDLLGEQITKASDITSEQADRILATFQTQEN
mgnify:CR=1 FL=1